MKPCISSSLLLLLMFAYFCAESSGSGATTLALTFGLGVAFTLSTLKRKECVWYINVATFIATLLSTAFQKFGDSFKTVNSSFTSKQ